MNGISWFLYASDIVSNIQGVLGFSAAVLLIIGGICILGFFIEEWEPGPRHAKQCIFFGILSCLLCSLIPSKATMYAIAASQISEQVLRSDQVQGIAGDATKALHAWIKKQTGPSKD